MRTRRGSATFKGCCMMCASQKGKLRQAGQAERQPMAALRLVGRRRRVSRHDLGDQERS